MEGAASKKRVLVLTAAGAVFVILLFLMLGPPKLLARSDQPAFCVSCHVMESEYEAWLHGGAHRRVKCVDCHLPNGNIGSHYSWKAIDGLKDVLVFYSGLMPDRVALSAHGKGVLQENCVRCHETTVEFINQDRTCWECHRRLMHKRSGLIETL